MNAYTVITGGAVGADTLAEKLAKDHGMNVMLKLCPHQPQVSEDRPALSRQFLEEAKPYVKIAADRLQRQPSINPFVRDLLAHNYYIMKDAAVLFAYAEFEDDALTTVKGGSGMTVQMFVDHNRLDPTKWKRVFVYDERRDKWFELERFCEYIEEYDESWTEALGDFRSIECVNVNAPLLYTSSAVVGSRTLGWEGQKMMRRQFDRTVKENARWQELRAWRREVMTSNTE